MCDCSFDCNYPEFSNTFTHQARKKHVCNECYLDILPGQTYTRDVGKFDGEFYLNKTCHRCFAVIKNVSAKIDFCYGLGQVYENLDQVDEEEIAIANIVSVPACRINDRDRPEMKILGERKDYAFLRFYYVDR